MYLTTLHAAILTLFTIAATASPVSDRPRRGVFQVTGPARRGIATLDGGLIDFDRWIGESQAIVKKYARNKKLFEANRGARAWKKRSTGTVPLGDDITASVDNDYYGAIQVGTPAQTLQVDFDTGSADLWCAATSPLAFLGGAAPGSFNPGSSSSFSGSFTPFAIVYGSGSVFGTLGSDKVSVGGLSIPQQYFGLGYFVSSDFSGLPFKGILGLGFASIATDGKPPVLDSLIAQGALDAPEVSFFLKHNSASGSEVTFGGRDANHIAGDFTWVPVSSQTYWEVEADGLLVDGKAAGGGFSAAIDTGTTLIYVPTAVATAFYAQIPGAAADSADGTGFYTYPCSINLEISLSFAGVQFPLDMSVFNIGSISKDTKACVGAVVGQDMPGVDGKNIAIIGDAFLINYYTVFSKNGPRVGFAKSK